MYLSITTENKFRGSIVLSSILLLCVSVISDAAWIDRTDMGGTVTASSQIHDGESKEMAFDNTTSTKWLTGYTATGWIQFQFSNRNRYTITKYSIASANDAPRTRSEQLDPVRIQ